MRNRRRIPLHEGRPEAEAIEAVHQLAFVFDPLQRQEKAWTGEDPIRTVVQDWTCEGEDAVKVPEDGWIQE